MLQRALLATLLAVACGAPAAQAGEEATSWSSILSDFVMGPQVQEEFHWKGRVASGKTIEIKGVNGSVVAIPAEGGDVVVDAIKKGRRQKPAEVEIKVVEHAQGLTLCAVYPTPRSGIPNECTPGPKGRMAVRNNDVAVEFQVKVPAGVRFVARTVNGSVRASLLTADVEAHTVNGSVTLDTRGHAQARTVNGSIRASLGQAQWQGEPLRFETVNGSVTVDLPAAASTSLDAKTVNGRIESSFPLAETHKASRTQLAGVIGKGGRALEVVTVNGSITLNRK